MGDYTEKALRGVIANYEPREAAALAERDARRKVSGIGSRPPADYVRFVDRKPYLVAETLEALCGPTQGMVTLPHHLDWSGHAVYDLNRLTRLASMYKIVLSEANTVGDLNAWLNADVLTRLWPTLWLPPQLRQIWERKFPALAHRTP